MDLTSDYDMSTVSVPPVSKGYQTTISAPSRCFRLRAVAHCLSLVGGLEVSHDDACPNKMRKHSFAVPLPLRKSLPLKFPKCLLLDLHFLSGLGLSISVYRFFFSSIGIVTSTIWDSWTEIVFNSEAVPGCRASDLRHRLK